MENLKKHSNRSGILFFILCNAIFSYGQNNSTPSINTDSLQVISATNEFLEAFRSLNWKKFSDSFAEDATAFFPPSSKFPYRANNKKEVESIFAKVFENFRKQRSEPPYVDIVPTEFKIQMMPNSAIVSFLLADPDLLGRRTLVFIKRKEKWLIIHLHASGALLTKNKE